MEKDLIKEALLNQKIFFQGHTTRSVSFRIGQLKKLRKAIKSDENMILDALYADLRKSPFEAYTTEIGVVYDEIDLHLKKLKKWAKPKRINRNIANPLAANRIYPEPYGSVLIISPWNYPFQLLINPLIGAISAGNCAILKPAEFSSNTSEVLQKIISKTFDKKYVHLFTGGKEINQELLVQNFDYIFFTGSPFLGRIVMKAAAEHLTPVTLELGGKSPCIIDKDMDIELAAKRVVWGKLLNAGQTCIAPDYIMVHTSVKQKFIEAAEKYIITVYGENPQKNKDYPRIINQKHFTRLVGLMKSGKRIFGGETNEADLYIAPTILDDVSPDDAVMQEEIFGPIFPILQFEKLDEVIRFITSRPKPLALYYFGKDKRRQNEIIKKTTSGGMCINDVIMHVVNNHLPFGGVGNSGMGRYHGKYSFQCFSNMKSAVKQANFFDIPLRYAPFTEKKFKWIKKLMG